jgi:hypothetical protein
LLTNRQAGRKGLDGHGGQKRPQLLADFEDVVLPLDGSETGTRDTLSKLLAQHEQEIHQLVTQHQGTIEELKKQNADLKAVLMEKDRVINRYYLDGPKEDEI